MARTQGPRARALRHVRDHFDDHTHLLGDLVRIPSVSAAGFDPGPVRTSAAAIADHLGRIGLHGVRTLELPGVHPYVYAEWMGRPGAPTVIVYGHHDVVPPGRLDHWTTPPFEPRIHRGRHYGRGSADDKGGILAHLAALQAYLATGGLPVNVRVLVEGEEEIGSTHLPDLLAAHADLFAGDVLVLSDTSNFDTGVPALTYRLRGLAQVDVEVRCLEAPVHSGMWGGPLPDAVQILCSRLARLTGEDGRIAVPGLYDQVRAPGAAERRSLRALSFDEGAFKREAGMRPGVRLAREKGLGIYEQLWTRPSVTVIAFEARPLQGASNQIVESARARLSMRTVPDMDGRVAAAQLIRFLTDDPPHGAHIEARLVRTTPWWETRPEGPAFDAARRALRAGFGRDAVLMGAGGSIGFVKPFSEHLPDAPCLLVGVEDPDSRAHSEDESLSLADWRKCMLAAVHLYDELATAVPPG